MKTPFLKPRLNVDMRLTFIKVAIEKYETWLSWAGHRKITDRCLEKIWTEDLPPFDLSI